MGSAPDVIEGDWPPRARLAAEEEFDVTLVNTASGRGHRLVTCWRPVTPAGVDPFAKLIANRGNSRVRPPI
jgi:hypothetical protein